MKSNSTWDTEYDVVVAGYGYAGGMAAITAHDRGASVAIFEKMAHFGGNSILSGGSCATGSDYESTLAYLRRTTQGTTPADMIETFARGMVALPAVLDRLAREVGFEATVDRRGGTYPFEGSDQLTNVHITRNPTYEGFPWATGTKAGGTLFWVLAKHVDRRAIAQNFKAPVHELITDPEGAVVGVLVEQEGELRRVRARRAVILACGGFEHNRNLIRNFMQVREAAAVSPLGNTGDGVLMAQKAGAALWHMWHVHGTYGFRIEGVPVAVRINFDGFRDVHKKMPWIALDRFGRRFMDEYPPAPQDTGMRALEYYDPDLQDYPRVPCHLVFDEEGRSLGPIGGKFRSVDLDIGFSWSEDNLAEVAAGIIRRFDSLEDLAGHLQVSNEVLQATVDRWNGACSDGRDGLFNRPPGTMMPLRTPPFYTIEAWPIITNTQGGPVHDAHQRVLDPYDRPIPGLYAAGELGSLFGHLYLLGGNLSECFIGGQIAGEQAAAQAVR